MKDGRAVQSAISAADYPQTVHTNIHDDLLHLPDGDVCLSPAQQSAQGHGQC